MYTHTTSGTVLIKRGCMYKWRSSDFSIQTWCIPFEAFAPKKKIYKGSGKHVLGIVFFCFNLCNVFQKLARSGARCDFGVFVGASSDNYSTLPSIGNMAAALKMYLNETFTTLKLDDISVWMKVYDFLIITRIQQNL